MFRDKKSQVTMFIILGIIILAVIFAVFYFLGDKIIKQSEKETVFTESSLEPLKDFVEGCIEVEGDKALDLIGRYGDISEDPGFGVMYHYDKIKYLCYTDNYSACYNRVPFLESYYEKQIDEYILDKLNNCIDLDLIRNEGYTVQAGELGVSTTIGEKVVIINVNYPIKISKGETVIEENRFSNTFAVPLGKIFEGVKDVIAYESNPDSLPIMRFDIVSYNLRTLGMIEISRDTIGDSVIYFVKLRDNDYTFRFAVRKWVH